MDLHPGEQIVFEGRPVWRSILYGLIESAPFTALVLVATANERRKRSRR